MTAHKQIATLDNDATAREESTMIERQQRVSRRQFLTTLGVLATGTAALAACGAAANPTVAPAATTAPTAPAAAASSAPSATTSSAPTAAASIAPTTAASSTPIAAVSIATRASTATAATPAGTRTTATASAAASGEGDVPNGNFGGSKFYSAVVDQKVEISSVMGALKWDKAQYTAKVGDVTFVVKNLGPMPHQLGVETSATKYESGVLAANTTTNLTIKGLAAGDYDLVCNIPGHKAAGMVAKLTVS